MLKRSIVCGAMLIAMPALATELPIDEEAMAAKLTVTYQCIAATGDTEPYDQAKEEARAMFGAERADTIIAALENTPPQTDISTIKDCRLFIDAFERPLIIDEGQ